MKIEDLEFKVGDLVCYNGGGLKKHTLGIVLGISDKPIKIYGFTHKLRVRIMWVKADGPPGRIFPIHPPVSDSNPVGDYSPKKGLGIVCYGHLSKISCIEKIKSS